MEHIKETKWGDDDVIYRVQVSSVMRNFAALVDEMHKNGIEIVHVFKNNVLMGYWELEEDYSPDQ